MTPTSANQPQDPRASTLYHSRSWGEARHPLPLGELARRTSQFKWLESKAFELTGQAVRHVHEPDLKLMLNSHSLHHGWHAQLWHNHIPETPAFNPSRQPVAPNEEYEAFISEVAATLATEASSAVKLVGLYRVFLPYSIVAYNTYAQAVSPITEAAVARSLHLILQDKINDWYEGEAALQHLVRINGDLPAVAKKQLELETILVNAGGFPTSQGLSF